MKLLLFIDSLGSGGAQRQLVELGKGFKEKGHEVIFLVYHNETFFKPELDQANIPVKTVIEPNYIKRIFKIRKAIRSEKPDAVLSFLEPANFMATLAGLPFRKWKLVVGERSANPKIYKTAKKIMFRWFHLFANHVVANSKANLEIVMKVSPFLSKKKCHVIYNIVNTPLSVTGEKPINQKINIVVAASYRQIKNTHNLIHAVDLLPNTFKNKLEIRWFGAANSTYYHDMKKLVEAKKLNEIIKLNDQTNEIFEKYADADFVGLFSSHEGFPNAICEAMKIGKPVIVPNISDIPIFIKEGVNGYLCDSNDVVSIKETLIKAIQTNDSLRKTMGRNNKNIAAKQFDKTKIVNAYLNLLVRE
ncbi:MAG: glycosyltransferase family 4 protein [Brumimicrobium sp.]|nr:glycosyltransferase family 4 protein [Brumimicrobium sp.]